MSVFWLFVALLGFLMVRPFLGIKFPWEQEDDANLPFAGPPEGMTIQGNLIYEDAVIPKIQTSEGPFEVVAGASSPDPAVTPPAPLHALDLPSLDLVEYQHDPLELAFIEMERRAGDAKSIVE